MGGSSLFNRPKRNWASFNCQSPTTLPTIMTNLFPNSAFLFRSFFIYWKSIFCADNVFLDAFTQALNRKGSQKFLQSKVQLMDQTESHSTGYKNVPLGAEDDLKCTSQAWNTHAHTHHTHRQKGWKNSQSVSEGYKQEKQQMKHVVCRWPPLWALGLTASHSVARERNSV